MVTKKVGTIHMIEPGGAFSTEPTSFTVEEPVTRSKGLSILWVDPSVFTPKNQSFAQNLALCKGFYISVFRRITDFNDVKTEMDLNKFDILILPPEGGLAFSRLSSKNREDLYITLLMDEDAKDKPIPWICSYVWICQTYHDVFGFCEGVLAAVCKKKRTDLPFQGYDKLPDFYCPITKKIMRNPHIAMDGFTYDKVALGGWVKRYGTSPITLKPMTLDNLIYNAGVSVQAFPFVKS